MIYRTLLSSILIVSILPFASGQQPQPASSPQRQQPPATPQTSTPVEIDSQEVVRITTNLVQIDVGVTKDGKPVAGLWPEDFEIFEDGKPQTITNFSYVSNVKTNAPASPAPIAKSKDRIAPPVAPAKINPNDQRRTVALVVDDLGMSFESMSVLRGQVKTFLDTLSADDLVAIIRTGGDVGALQQFTTDRRVLQTALDHLKWNPCSRTGLYVFQPAGGGGMPGLCSQYTLNKTLSALRFITKGMGYLPGRKSMVVFSDYLPIQDEEPSAYEQSRRMISDTSSNDPQTTSDDEDTSYYAQLELVAEQAIRSAVVIYSVDTRGLQYTGPTAADRITFSHQEAMSAGPVASLISERSRLLVSRIEGADLIARQTGGFLVRNSNDFGLKRVMEDQQGYYLIGFRPSEESFDHNFHHIKAKLKRGGYSVHTRAGFYGYTDDHARPQALSPSDRMLNALISPFGANEVMVRLTSFFLDDPTAGPTLRSFIYLDPQDLKFTEQADGWHVANLEIKSILFGDNGRVAGQEQRIGTLRFRGPEYERVLREGITYNFDIPMKARGPFQFRVAVRDLINARVGSAGQYVEIPSLKNGRIALSGVVARAADSALTNPAGGVIESIAEGPAVRRFRSGSHVLFAYEIYNASAAGRQPQLTTQIRVFRDGKVIFTGTEVPISLQGQSDLQRIGSASQLQLSSEMLPGNYVCQIIVRDVSVKDKPRVATQWIDFEILP